MSDSPLPWKERRALGAFVRRSPQVHLGIGLLGNALFIVGSALFLAGHEQATWLFLMGSCGMFTATLGEVVRQLGKRRLWSFDVDPVDPDLHWSDTERSSSSLDVGTGGGVVGRRSRRRHGLGS